MDPGLIAPPSDDPYEIVVYAEDRVADARIAVIRALEKDGWKRLDRRPDGDILLKPPEPWMGKARLTADGEISFGRRMVSLAPSNDLGTPYSAEATMDRNDLPSLTQAQIWTLPSKRVTDGAEGRTLDSISDELSAWRDALRDSRFEEGLSALPGRLDRLWTEGAPLNGSTRLETPEARRAAILDLWARRADTPEGERTKRVIEAWMDEAIEPKITAQEKRAAQDRR